MCETPAATANMQADLSCLPILLTDLVIQIQRRLSVLVWLVAVAVGAACGENVESFRVGGN